MRVPKFNWIPFDRYNPPADLAVGGEYLILLRKDHYDDGASWTYSVDVGTAYGDYIDDFWDTENDWCEGQRVEVVAYSEIPCYFTYEQLVEVDENE